MADPVQQDMPHGGENALTAEAGAVVHHEEPNFQGLNATHFVSIAMVVLILVILWQSAHKAIGRALDARIAGIRSQLDEAKALRAEAEAMRDRYQAQLAGAESEAARIRASAEAEAAALVAKAESDTAALIQRRTAMAETKIGAAERAAVADLRAGVARAASQAAASLIASGHGAEADRQLVDGTIAELGKRLN